MLKKVLKMVGLKVLEEILSVKVHLIVLATIALFYGKLESTAYATIVTSLGLGRVLIDSIVAHHQLKSNGNPKEDI